MLTISQELIKYKGLQISPTEIEAILVSQEQILDAAVIGIPDPNLPGNEIPRAFVVRKGGQHPITVEEINRLVNDQLSAHKRLRGGVEFIDQVPRNPSGKILRRALRDRQVLKRQVKL